MYRRRRRRSSYNASERFERAQFDAPTRAPVPGVTTQDSTICRGAKEAYVITEVSGLAKLGELCSDMPEAERCGGSFTGNMSYDRTLAALIAGDESGVALSDKYLKDIED